MTALNGGTPRMFLARELRRAREGKGISRSELAKAFYVSEVLVRQWETGHRAPVMDHVTKLDEMFDIRGILVRIREDLVKASVPLEWFGRWTEIEGRASSLWSFQPMVVPGLLQTEDYARAILQAANHLADVVEMVNARMERQKILHRDEEPPMFVALIAESVLSQNVGGPDVMARQLVHFSELARRENVITQIVPARATVCAGFTGPFMIVFRVDALSRQESVILMTRMAGQWKN
ncbi:helix-turn-helix transcriptional regulator [Sphaerisporangium rubeum]|uniref:Transcriptional regulator with XRE-family HTH domain n=1 Tax=Sphaerisporangium rubeum TaxID=321317 RepID=A0A7X0I9S5_9ACTN|nr:helix-turn-helix transcriptional regulator [Sphaerisporangium rubeum]MBB6471083.1 transcriptional regulator with XRE-family HTH domain [Sphaerisporangium rubeum]